jgi:hypothetical protein
LKSELLSRITAHASLLGQIIGFISSCRMKAVFKSSGQINKIGWDFEKFSSGTWPK